MVQYRQNPKLRNKIQGQNISLIFIDSETKLNKDVYQKDFLENVALPGLKYPLETRFRLFNKILSLLIE